MLGQKSMYADECYAGGFIGAHYDIDQDLTNQLPDEWRHFNKAFIPKYLAIHPEKTKIGAGLACGALWSVSKGIQVGDIVLCPDGLGRYLVGEVTGNYQYVPNQVLPHRRSVRWLKITIDRSVMSDALRGSTGSIGTVSNITHHRSEIDQLIGNNPISPLIHTDPTVENPSAFALEAHLEHFLVRNWSHTQLGQDYDIYE
jgi:restriction system protein